MPRRKRSSIIDTLREQGILPHGSPELALYEKRLTRYFSREYSKTQENPRSLAELGISSRTGPMVLQTEDLMGEHYDQGLPLFRSFLDHEFMAYTMAYYGDSPEEARNNEATLEQAQKAKFDLICERTGITGSERAFSIGCGFGPLETYLLRRYPNLQLTSITPSDTQASYIRQRMREGDHPLGSGRLQLIEGDFSTLPASRLTEEAYDVVFAIGVFEHINNLYSAFERIAGMLREGGKCFLHLIVSQPAFPEFQDSSTTLIGKYFPGGRIWPFRDLETQTDFFELKGSWFVNGTNYWRTLDEWHRRFWDHIDELYGTILTADGVRHWNDYFILCKVVLFAPLDGTIYGNGHYLFEKKPT